MKQLAAKIFTLVYKLIKENKPLEVCVGEIELLLREFDRNVGKDDLKLDESVEPESYINKEFYPVK